MAKTKIVATIGPVTESTDQLTKLAKAGVDVFRLNSKHNEVSWHRDVLTRVKEVGKKLQLPLATLVDLQGPEIRVLTPEMKPVEVKKGEEFAVTDKEVKNGKYIMVNQPTVLPALKSGDLMLIEDGLMQFYVTGIKNGYPIVKAMGNYKINNRKNLNLPNVDFDLPLLSKRDREFIKMAGEENATFLALSFVRTGQDLRKLKQEATKLGFKGAVIAKIENRRAIENLDEIIAESDALMVARGDLGVEVPMEQIAYLQDVIIQKSRNASKPVITATQMLQSMVENPLPTRAEVTDVSNAILDGTDAVMLSAESANGKHPIAAVETLERVAAFNEKRDVTTKLDTRHAFDQTESVTYAAAEIITHPRHFAIDAICVFTETGSTAHALARFRPQIPIFALTRSQEVQEKLMLSYGVVPLTIKAETGKFISLDKIIEYLKDHKLVKSKHRMLFIHGTQWQVPGQTNSITIREVV